jgi:hypothetical protein
MKNNSFVFKLGNFKCKAVSDGTFSYPDISFNQNVLKGHLHKVFREHDLQSGQITNYTNVCMQELTPIKNRLNLMYHEIEILPGIHDITAPGHAPGHIALSISADGDHLLCTSDTVLSPIHLEKLDWCPVFDLEPEQAATTKRKIFDQATVEKSMVFSFHFPFPGLGHVIKGKNR